METIDKKVQKVFESEKEKLEEQKDLKTFLDSLKDLPFGIDSNLSIPQKDTIGKSICFNVPKF